MINLIRNLETKRNQEQEDVFENSFNYSLFFDSNKKIEKIDSWKFSNIKKLVNVLKKENIELEIEFVLWNKNIEYIHSSLKSSLKSLEKLEQKIIDEFKEINIEKIHNTLLQAKDNKNKKLSILLLIAETINDLDSINLANKSINQNILTIDTAIDILLPKLLLMKKDK